MELNKKCKTYGCMYVGGVTVLTWDPSTTGGMAHWAMYTLQTGGREKGGRRGGPRFQIGVFVTISIRCAVFGFIRRNKTVAFLGTDLFRTSQTQTAFDSKRRLSANGRWSSCCREYYRNCVEGLQFSQPISRSTNHSRTTMLPARSIFTGENGGALERGSQQSEGPRA